MKHHSHAPSQMEAHALEAWEIAQRKIHIGDAIPKKDQEDVRSDLYLKYAKDAAYYEGRENFGGVVYHSMNNDVRDEIEHRKSAKVKFHESMQPLVSTDPESGETSEADAIDENMSLENFLGDLDRKERNRKLRNWRRRFRNRVRSLDEEMQKFLFLMSDCTTQDELASASGLCRKACYLRRKRLQEIFGGLLREHRNIKALEIK